jgi:hypothetical protein
VTTVVKDSSRARRALSWLLVAVAAVVAGDAAAYARMCTSADTLQFGNRTVGTTTVQRATVRNCGDEPWSFTGVFVHPASGPAWHVDTTCATGGVLAPAAACTIDVTFAPLVAGQTSGALWLHNSTVTPDQLVTFYGRGIDARSGTAAVAFDPSVADVGSQPVGRLGAPRVLLVRNVGTSSLTPSALVLNGPAALDFRTLGSGEADECAVGTPVAPGAACRINLFFEPSVAGTRRANLVIDAPELPSLAILSIVGQGVDPSVAASVTVVEYYHAPTGQYFLTAEPAEQAFLDGGGLGPDWVRTGLSFRATARDASADMDVCRFFGTPGVGPNEHFYTADATECAKVRADPLWQQEGIAFRASPPASGACAAGRASVVRLWRPGDDAQASRHRYLVDAAEIARMAAAGWIVEGPVFCPPA